MTCEIIDTETSEAGTHSTQLVFVNIRQVLGSIVDGSKIILHALTCPVATDLFQPFLSETRQTTTVGGYYHVTIRSHDHEVPTIAPELGNRTLRSTLTEEQGGVLLRFVEVRRQNHPGQHILAITGFHPTLLDSGFGQLVENVLILKGQLGNLCLLRLLEVGCDDIEVGRRCVVVSLHQQLLAIIHQRDGSEVIPSFCELLQFTFPVDSVKVLCSMPYTNEVDHRILRITPYKSIDVRVKALSDIFFLASS